MERQPTIDPATMTTILTTYGIVVLFFFVFSIVIGWRIATKAGYAGAASLLMIVPFVNFIVLCIFAFTEWPIQRALKAERALHGMVDPAATGAYLPPPTV